MAMKSFKKIMVSVERSILQAAGASRVADRPTVSQAGNATCRKHSRYFAGRTALANALCFSFLCFVILALAGCSSLKPQLGAISVTDPTISVTDPTGNAPGQLTTVIVNASANVSAAISNAGQNLGVDWSLTCAGSPNTIETKNVCGTLNAFHAGSGSNILYTAPAYVPIGGTVTLTATATSAPSESASVTLAILPQPVTIAWTVGFAPPAEMASGGSISLEGTVFNDPTAAGVNWSCAPVGSCGSFTPPQTSSYPSYTAETAYTAPATVPSDGIVVTVTATPTCESNPVNGYPVCASTASISAQINIISGSVSQQLIGVSVTLPPNSLQLGGSTPLTATVQNDSSTSSNDGVNWVLQSCDAGAGACGAISSTSCVASGVAPAPITTTCSSTYTAPSSIPANDASLSVAVTAISTDCLNNPNAAECSVGSTPTATAYITIAPTTIEQPATSVHFVPFAPSTLSVSNPSSPAPVNLIAVAANDSTNAGVEWSVACADAPTTADPLPCGGFLVTPSVPATLTTLAVPAVYSTTLPSVASGQTVGYLPPTAAPSNKTVTITAASVADSSYSAPATITITDNTTGFAGVNLTGRAMAGNFPVSGASVYLYEAGNTGYGSQASPLAISSNGGYSVSTGNDGSFTIPAGYTCVGPASLLYLVALYGTPQGAVQANPQLGLMTALGPCGNLNSTVSLVVNEVTTVATLWALAPFIAPGADSPYLFLGSSSANYNNGLANAFATVNNLVDITTGQALAYTPAGGVFPLPITTPPPANPAQFTTGVVPQAEIDTLADAIDTCAATSGGAPGDGSPCDAFFLAANTNSNPGYEPTNILQAVLGIAQNPGNPYGFDIRNPYPSYSGTPLYDLVFNPVNVGWTPPFNPTLLNPNLIPNGAPTDWSIALSYTGGGMEGGLEKKGTKGNSKLTGAGSIAMAIDASGNLWIANQSFSTVTELSNTGAALSPFSTDAIGGYGGFTNGGLNSPLDIAIDPFGSAWVLNGDSSLTELDSTGAPVICASAVPPPNPFCGGSALNSPFSYEGGSANKGVGLAIDGKGNLWVADGPPNGATSAGDVAEYAGFNGGVNVATGLPVTNGEPISASGQGYTALTDDINNSDPSDANPANPQAIAIDGKSNVWVLDKANYAAVELNGASGQLQLVDHGFNNGSPVLSPSQWGYTLAIDSKGNIFIPEIVDSTALFSDIFELYAPGSASDPNSIGKGQEIPPISACQSTPTLCISPPVDPPIAIDGSGNQWFVTQAGASENGIDPSFSLSEYSASGKLLNVNWIKNTTADGYGYVDPLSPLATPQSIAVDASGNVWLLIPGTPTSTVTEFVGVATPVVTPLSVGVQKNKLGAKP
jgi:hypothetical protein